MTKNAGPIYTSENKVSGYERHLRYYARAILLSFRFIRKYAYYKGNSVLLLRDRKNTPTLHITINDESSDGK